LALITQKNIDADHLQQGSASRLTDLIVRRTFAAMYYRSILIRFGLLALLVGLTAPTLSSAQTPESVPVEQDTDSPSAPTMNAPNQTPEERLSAAVRTYQTGRLNAGRDAFSALIDETSYTNPFVRQQARVYLGEVFYLLGEQENARRIFEGILTEDVNYTIDPFRHPPDVCGFFETIRTYIRPTTPPNVRVLTPQPTLPAIGYMGFGLYQLRYGRTKSGAILLAGQTISGLLSVAMMASLYIDRSSTTASLADKASVSQRRAIQWTSTGAFYGFWAVGTYDAAKHWRTTVTLHPSEQNKKWPKLPGPPGLGLNISGHFH
jgi:hypothetical protein